MNSVSVNLHNYYNNFENLHIFNLIDVSGFGTWMCKIEQFLYFALFDANALRVRLDWIYCCWNWKLKTL